MHGAAPALLIAAATRFRGLILVITPDSQAALPLETELRMFGGAELEILALPDWETLPYDGFSPHQDIVSQRLVPVATLTAFMPASAPCFWNGWVNWSDRRYADAVTG